MRRVSAVLRVIDSLYYKPNELDHLFPWYWWLLHQYIVQVKEENVV
jgi:hypothetical protein